MEEKIFGKNKMAVKPIGKLFWAMGLPMILSMVLQALYNVVDSVFVANIKGIGAVANQALTLAFPVQILMIAVGVGTGVGINACLSKSLGEGDGDRVNKIAGNGIFLSLAIYAVFLVFGLFACDKFISLFSADETVIKTGGEYLKICCCFSLGSIGFTVYERFLQATGKTVFSTVAQVAGAATNIVLDYVFIFPLNGGVAGAAWATVIGQFVSLILAAIFHYALNKEINGSIKHVKPNARIIKSIYKIGVSAAIMQALLSVMMACVNAVLSAAKTDVTVLVGSFGIYYKAQQIALFSAFGLSNTIITLLSFNYGLKDGERSAACVKAGVWGTVLTSLVITAIFEVAARPIAQLFALSGGSSVALVSVTEASLKTGAAGFAFMGFTVAVQGVLQALGYAAKPLGLSALRLLIFVVPITYLFTLTDNVVAKVWWAFPIAEILTDFFSAAFLVGAVKKKIKPLNVKA